MMKLLATNRQMSATSEISSFALQMLMLGFMLVSAHSTWIEMKIIVVLIYYNFDETTPYFHYDS